MRLFCSCNFCGNSNKGVPDIVIGGYYVTTSLYYYRVFGLTVASEYELPELETIAPLEEPDVRIVVEKTPPELAGATVCRPQLQVAPQSLLLKVRVAGDFWVRDGREIIVNPLPDAPPENVRSFLLGSALGALLHQRGILPVHGSALVYQGQAFILTGVTGAGKSTLAAALVRKGCRLLTDDVAAITFDSDGTPRVQPAYPQQKLWRDSAAAMKLTTGRLIRVMADMEKYAVRVTERYHEGPAALFAVFHLIKPAGDESGKLSLEIVQGVDKLPLILHNVYRPHFVKGLGIQEEHFQRCFKLAEKVKAARVYRTKELGELEELADLAIHHF
jgi:hypothetical protein